MNKKGFDFPGEWTKITLHKRNLNFAWGPQGGGEITKIGRIEFIVASVNGGKGTIYLDDLKIEKLDPPSVPTSDPVVSFSDNKLTIAENQLFDNNPQTFWSGGEGINHFELNIDFTVQKEFGGIVTDWANNGFPAKYIFEGSNDKNNWTKLSESKGKSGKSYIVTPEARYRYLRLKIQNDKANELRLNDIVLKNLSFGDNYNNLYYEIAAESPKGRFPRYTLKTTKLFYRGWRFW
jgi:hypothetical protein